MFYGVSSHAHRRPKTRAHRLVLSPLSFAEEGRESVLDTSLKDLRGSAVRWFWL